MEKEAEAKKDAPATTDEKVINIHKYINLFVKIFYF
jgi:hypothetical protein